MATPTIGQLRNRLTFNRDVTTSDGSGGTTSVKVLDFELWGFITKVSDFDATRAGQEVGYNAVEIWVLYQSDKYPNKQHIIVCGDYYYTINGIREIDEARRWVVMSATRNLVDANYLPPPPPTTSYTADTDVITADTTLITADSN